MLWVGGDVIAGSISAGELAAFVSTALIVGMAFGTLSEVIGSAARRRRQSASPSCSGRAARSARQRNRKLAARVSGRIGNCRRCASPIRPVPNTGLSTTSAWPSNRGNPGPGRTFRRRQVDPVRSAPVSSIRSRDGCCWTDSRSSNWTRPTCAAVCPGVAEPALFFGSVEENIRYGRPHASAAEVEAAAPRMPTSSSWVCRRATPPPGRGRHRPVRRPAPAPGDRPGVAGRRAGAAARRGRPAPWMRKAST